MTVNTKLSVRGCWRLVSAIQNGKTPEEIRRRCEIAEEWLTDNEILTDSQYEALMATVGFLFNESWRIAPRRVSKAS